MKRIYQEAVTTAQVTLTALDCSECGVVYGIASDYEQRRRQDGKSFLCPNGHWQSYGKSEAEKLREQLVESKRHATYLLSRVDQERAAAKELERSRNAFKGVATKLRKRAEAGVCADCHRTFQNVARHMQTKHGVHQPEVSAVDTKINARA